MVEYGWLTEYPYREICASLNRTISDFICCSAGSTATLEITRVAEPGGSEYILTVADQNLVHACCTASRGSNDAGVVRLDEESDVCGVEAGRVCIDGIADDAEGWFAGPAG